MSRGMERQIAHELKQALIASNLSQADFARQAGTSAKHLNEVLNGASGAQPSTLDHWATVLGQRWVVRLVARQ